MKQLLTLAAFQILGVVQMVAETCGKGSATISEDHFRLLANLSAVMECDHHHSHGHSQSASKKKSGGYAAPLPPQYYDDGMASPYPEGAPAFDEVTLPRDYVLNPVLNPTLNRATSAPSFDGGGGASKQKQKHAGSSSSSHRRTRRGSVASGRGRRAIKGGRVLMPSEYFGIDSGQYHESVSPGNMPWSDPNLTRTALPVTNDAFGPPVDRASMNCGSGGGGTKTGNSGSSGQPFPFITDSMVTSFVKEYNERSNSKLRLTEGAKHALKVLVAKNVVEMLRDVRPSTSSSSSSTTAATASSPKTSPKKQHQHHGGVRLTAALVDKVYNKLRTRPPRIWA